MKKVFILLLLVLSNISFSQTKEGMEICLAMQSNNFISDSEAENALDKILNTIGASKNFILVPCSKTNNAAATAYKGIRYILYDKEFMQLISSRTNNWSSLAILAHEVGHHINGHSLDILLYTGGAVETKSLERKRQQELEADEFAGFVMARLGASINDALSFTNIFTEKDDTYSTHPSKSKRVNAVIKGFNKAGTNTKVAKTTKISKEYPRKTVNMSFEEYINRGFDKFKLNDNYGALSDFTAALRIKPDYEMSYIYLAGIKEELKDYYGAIADLNKAIKINPDMGLAYYVRGMIKYDLKDYNGAIVDITKSLEINPNIDYAEEFNLNPYSYIGMIKYDLKDYNGAIVYYTKAIKLNIDGDDETLYSSYLGRGNAKAKLKNYYNAIIDYLNAIEINPNGYKAYDNMGIVKLNGLKDYNGAMEDFTKAINLNIDVDDESLYSNTFVNRGYIKTQLNDFYGAFADFTKAIKTYPNNGQAYFNRAIINFRWKDYSKGCADLNKAVNINGKDSEFWENNKKYLKTNLRRCKYY